MLSLVPSPHPHTPIHHTLSSPHCPLALFHRHLTFHGRPLTTPDHPLPPYPHHLTLPHHHLALHHRPLTCIHIAI